MTSTAARMIYSAVLVPNLLSCTLCGLRSRGKFSSELCVCWPQYLELFTSQKCGSAAVTATHLR